MTASETITGLISDVPGEAMLTPQLWGKLQILFLTIVVVNDYY